MNAFARVIATLGPVGFAPIVPATVGSAVVTAIAWFVPVEPLPIALGGIAVLAIVAIWSSGIAEQTLGHDAHPIVIDEAVGQSIALLFVPRLLWAYAAAFLLFRIFDVWKPLGAREVQRLPGGYGVVTDDVIAGATACAAFQLGMLGLRAMGVRGI